MVDVFETVMVDVFKNGHVIASLSFRCHVIASLSFRCHVPCCCHCQRCQFRSQSRCLELKLNLLFRVVIEIEIEIDIEKHVVRLLSFRIEIAAVSMSSVLALTELRFGEKKFRQSVPGWMAWSTSMAWTLSMFASLLAAAAAAAAAAACFTPSRCLVAA